LDENRLLLIAKIILSFFIGFEQASMLSEIARVLYYAKRCMHSCRQWGAKPSELYKQLAEPDQEMR
jgi:hypothetical protein